MLNLMTEASYRVRWLTVTYQNLQGKKLRTHAAFLIEHKNRVADRLNLLPVDEQRINRTELDPTHATRAALFNYFIGNADFSIVAATEGSCCHNAESYFALITNLPMFPSFMISIHQVTWMRPTRSLLSKLDLRNVRQRIYRGFCTDPEVLDGVLDEFRDKREALFAVAAETEYVGKRSARKGVSYLTDFYSVIDNPKRLKKKIIEVCR